jgi:hypothetical protein
MQGREHFKKHVFYNEKGRFLEKSRRGGQVQQTKISSAP